MPRQRSRGSPLGQKSAIHNLAECANAVPDGIALVPNEEKSSQLDPDDLNRKQLAAIELLAIGKSFSVIAKTLNVDRRTIFKWRQKDWFQDALRHRHRELWGDVSDRLRMLVDPSLEVLVEHLNDHYDRNRFRAASAILRLAKLCEDRAPE